MTRALGYRHDVVDPRDQLFRTARGGILRAGPVPAIADVDMWDVPPKDQGGRSSCVGGAIAGALRRSYVASGQACPELSMRGSYRLALSADGYETDEGSHIRSGIRAVQALGCPTEEACPFVDDRDAVLAELTPDEMATAFDLSGIRGYYRIWSGDLDAIRLALGAGCAVVAGWDVDEAFVRSRGLDVFRRQSPPFAGGHAMAILGCAPSGYYRERVPTFTPAQEHAELFRILQTWGEGVGHFGRIFGTPDFVAEARDIWAIEIGEAS